MGENHFNKSVMLPLGFASIRNFSICWVMVICIFIQYSLI